MSISGLDIKIRLAYLKQKGIHATQRWLLALLKERGYTLTEPMLSDILRGQYPYKQKEDILDACNEILSQFEIQDEESAEKKI